MNGFDRARAVADAVLYEGFLLYPYTASARKNQQRWQFGVLMPQGYSDASEPSATETTLLARIYDDAARIQCTVRFLQQREGIDVEERAIAFTADAAGSLALPFAIDVLRGRIVLDAEPDGDYVRIRLNVRNDSAAPGGATRNQALSHALIGAHAIFTIEGGAFISLLDPPENAREAAARCTNRRLYPVLAGDCAVDERHAQTVLASPIILYDFPQLSSQTTPPMFDATEIEELLLLSVASMSDAERAEACETSPRGKAIVNRAESMDASLQTSLHGRLSIGERVRVHPKRRADAIDFFTDGMTARVQAVHEDADGRRYVSVLFEGDPASDLHEWYGRSFFYDPDEIERLDGAP